MDVKKPLGTAIAHKKPAESLPVFNALSKGPKHANGRLSPKELAERTNAVYLYLLKNNLFFYLLETKQIHLIQKLFYKNSKVGIARPKFIRKKRRMRKACRGLLHKLQTHAKTNTFELPVVHKQHHNDHKYPHFFRSFYQIDNQPKGQAQLALTNPINISVFKAAVRPPQKKVKDNAFNHLQSHTENAEHTGPRLH